MGARRDVLVFCLIYVTLYVTYAYDDSADKEEAAYKILQKMAETRRGLGALREVIEGIDDDLLQTEKRWGAACNVGAGMSGYQCHLASLRSDNKAQEWLSSSPLSPGKRSGAGAGAGAGSEDDSPATSQAIEGRIRDIQTKRKGLQVLKKILQEMDADLLFEQKRTCKVNLGGHCATESAASVADQWHYLNSPLSPGRKRRDTRLYRKLFSGKLLA